MANSVQNDRHGPDWPLGNIVVTVPGTPVNIMNLVDASSVNAPGTAAGPGASTSDEYSGGRFQQILFQGVKAGVAHGLVNNTGNIYIVRKGVGAGTGNRDDLGSIVAMLPPGGSYILSSAAMNLNVFSAYRYSIDADNANDGCQVTGFVA